MSVTYERETPPHEDSERLRRARAGDPEALHALLEPYYGTVFRLAYRVTSHVEDAEDLTQEAFVRVIGRLPSFRGECAFGTWVYRVALNACISDRRRRRPVTLDLHPLALPDGAPGPEARAIGAELQGRIRGRSNGSGPPTERPCCCG